MRAPGRPRSKAQPPRKVPLGGGEGPDDCPPLIFPTGNTNPSAVLSQGRRGVSAAARRGGGTTQRVRTKVQDTQCGEGGCCSAFKAGSPGLTRRAVPEGWPLRGQVWLRSPHQHSSALSGVCTNCPRSLEFVLKHTDSDGQASSHDRSRVGSTEPAPPGGSPWGPGTSRQDCPGAPSP